MSTKFQRSLIAIGTQPRQRFVFETLRYLTSRNRGHYAIFVAVCMAGTLSNFTIAAEIPRQKNQTERQQVDVGKLAAIQEFLVAAAANDAAANNDRASIDPASIDKLLSDLDPASKRAIEAVPALINALRSPETSALLRERVGTMLGRIGEPARGAVPVLVGYLAQFKSKTGSEPAGAATISKEDDVRYWVMKSLCLFGPVAADAVPAVRAILISKDVSPRLRLLAADTLGQLRSPAAIGVLTRQLLQPRRNNSYEETLLRQTMIDSLAMSGPLAVGALPALSRATEDSNADIRRSACQAIGSLGPRAEGALTSLLERLVLDDDAAVKDASADALARIGSLSVPALTDLLERGGPDLQWRAAKSLGQIGPRAKDAVPQLRRTLQSPDNEVRIESIDALWRISRDPNPVAAALVGELSTDDRQVRRRAAQLLIGIELLPVDISKELEQLTAADNSDAARAAAYVLRERSRKPDQ